MHITVKELLLVFGTPVLLGIALLFALNWRRPAIFLGFFLWIHVEDLVRILLGNFVLVFFVKTLLFAAMVLGYVYSQLWRRRKGLWQGFPVTVPLFVFAGLALVQSLNPGIEHPLVPLIGFHAQFLYIPMFLLAYQYFDSEARVRQFLMFTFALTAFESLLTVPQMVLGPAWWYSLVGKPDTLEMFVARTGARPGEELVRPSSIFANAGRFTQYLSVVGTILVGALFYARNARERLLTGFCFFCLAVAVFVTSGRTTMYLLVLTVAAFLILGFARHRAKLRVTLMVAAAAFVVLAAAPSILGNSASFIQNLFLQPILSFDATRGSGSLVARIVAYASSTSRAVMEAGWVGHGLGTNSLGLYFIGAQTDGEEPGFAALIWEYGVVGLCLWLFTMGMLWLMALRTYRSLRNTHYKPLAASIVFLMAFAFVYQYIGYQILQNYLVALHFWAMAGLLFALPRLVEAPDPGTAHEIQTQVGPELEPVPESPTVAAWEPATDGLARGGAWRSSRT